MGIVQPASLPRYQACDLAGEMGWQHPRVGRELLMRHRALLPCCQTRSSGVLLCLYRVLAMLLLPHCRPHNSAYSSCPTWKFWHSGSNCSLHCSGASFFVSVHYGSQLFKISKFDLQFFSSVFQPGELPGILSFPFPQWPGAWLW